MGSAVVQVRWCYSSNFEVPEYKPVFPLWRERLSNLYNRHSNILINYKHHFVPCWQYKNSYFGRKYGCTDEDDGKWIVFPLSCLEYYPDIPIYLGKITGEDYFKAEQYKNELNSPDPYEFHRIHYNKKWYIADANGGFQLGFAYQDDAVKFKLKTSIEQIREFTESWHESL